MRVTPEEYKELLEVFQQKLGSRTQFLADFEESVNWLLPVRSFLVLIAITIVNSAVKEDWEELKLIPNNYAWSAFRETEKLVGKFLRLTRKKLKEYALKATVELMLTFAALHIAGIALSIWIN